LCYTESISTLSDNDVSPIREIFHREVIWVVGLALVIGGVGLGVPDGVPASASLALALGGPAFYDAPAAATPSYAYAAAPRAVAEPKSEDIKPLFIGESGAAVGAAEPASNVIPLRHGLKKYKVQDGDTLSGIAAGFGISLNTITWANPETRTAALHPGQELTILPVTGFLYTLEEGDTLEDLAARYGVSEALIIKYNPTYPALLASPGEQLVLPHAEPVNTWAYLQSAAQRLPKLDDYFALPARGWNWGKLHYDNAVDIAAKCGDPVYAAAEGIVEEESSGNYWNEGYGNYVVVRHANGTETKYAHTLKNLVSVGDYVLQGEEIALIGNTGNVSGPTGCHLHFEVHGAQNPFAAP